MLNPFANLKGYRGLSVATWGTGMCMILTLALIFVFQDKFGKELIELGSVCIKAIAGVAIAYQGKNIAEGLPGRRTPPPPEDK
jgi:hypothetical protein